MWHRRYTCIGIKFDHTREPRDKGGTGNIIGIHPLILLFLKNIKMPITMTTIEIMVI